MSKKKYNHQVDVRPSEPVMAELTNRLNIKPPREELFIEAFTHSSYAHEHAVKDNERLELLGDSVLGVIVCQFLYQGFPKQKEGDLAKLKAIIVSAPVLAQFSKGLGLERYLKLGQGEIKTRGSQKLNILADLFEAFIGAYFLNFGLEMTADFVLPLIKNILPDIFADFEKLNAKTNLQELTQARGYKPEYRLVKEEGPSHDKTFTTEVLVNQIAMGSGTGKTIKEAQNNAALEAIKKQKIR